MQIVNTEISNYIFLTILTQIQFYKGKSRASNQGGEITVQVDNQKIHFDSIEEEINFLMVNDENDESFKKKENCFIDLASEETEAESQENDCGK